MPQKVIIMTFGDMRLACKEAQVEHITQTGTTRPLGRILPGPGQPQDENVG